jgi:hypothetical protein
VHATNEQEIAGNGEQGLGVMLKITYAVVGAAIGAACLVAVPSLSQQVQASAPTLGAKGDRVDARPLGAACSQHEWPYYEAACLRDAKNPFGEARAVRIVSTDHLPQPVAGAVASR